MWKFWAYTVTVVWIGMNLLGFAIDNERKWACEKYTGADRCEQVWVPVVEQSEVKP